jgi:hypothetical protein
MWASDHLPDPSNSYDPVAILRDAPLPGNPRFDPHVAASYSDMEAALTAALSQLMPWLSRKSIRIVCDLDSCSVFFSGARPAVHEALSRLNGHLSLGIHDVPTASRLDWALGEERERCAELVNEVIAERYTHMVLDGSQTAFPDAVAVSERATQRQFAHFLGATDDGGAEAGACNACHIVLFEWEMYEAPLQWLCPACECCTGCGRSPRHGECMCAGCQAVSPPAAVGLRVPLMINCGDNELQKVLVALQEEFEHSGGTVHNFKFSLCPRAADDDDVLHAIIAWHPRDDRTPSITGQPWHYPLVSSLLRKCGAFPNLDAALSPHFDFALAAEDPDDFLTAAVIWLLVQTPMCTNGFTIFGGAIRDYVLRRVWPIGDIDVELHPEYVADPTETWLFDKLAAALRATPLHGHISIEMAEKKTKPGVPQRVTLSCRGANLTVEMVDRNHFMRFVDMSFNNLELSRAGLGQHFPFQGGTLLHNLRDVLRRRGIVVNWKTNVRYQKERRSKRTQILGPRQFQLANIAADFTACAPDLAEYHPGAVRVTLNILT